MLTFSLRLFLLTLCLMTGQASAQTSDKLDVLVRVNAIMSELLVIAAERQSPSQRTKPHSRQVKVERLIRRLDSLEVLARLSASSRAYMHPGRAQDHMVDNVFDESWHSCIRRIERIGGRAAIATLQDIALEQRLDGAYALTLEASLERLKAKPR